MLEFSYVRRFRAPIAVAMTDTPREGRLAVKRCASCNRPATRRRLDRSTRRMIWLCDDCPSSREIRQRAARIQKCWDGTVRLARLLGVSRKKARQWWDAPYVPRPCGLEPWIQELLERQQTVTQFARRSLLVERRRAELMKELEA